MLSFQVGLLPITLIGDADLLSLLA